MAEQPYPHPPDDRRYYREHEWAKADAPDTVVIGITDYAVGELGDIVWVQLPEIGTRLGQFERFGEIESVKAVSDLFTPVSGEIVAVNQGLAQHPELVGHAPFTDGWMLRIRLAAPAEMDRLMDAEAYRNYIEGLG